MPHWPVVALIFYYFTLQIVIVYFFQTATIIIRIMTNYERYFFSQLRNITLTTLHPK
ncbi:hypothetical protein MTBBW1_1950004 [Desulfamplus magnetovallimortis]|uniref:Uncharacterized protein n=1 Tax=Desulfamplus magnetovallimortis TaxID=1246637 RepID=A0A1W1HBJ5_9BACT|nr:hypothetical protein MTBBW1_1950004 [Desulfamplus magnetovallimortis]